MPVLLTCAVLALAQGCATNKFTLESAEAGAARGDAKALYFLAKQYAKGKGVAQDAAKAAEYMRQAAEKGHAFAQNDLGAFYANGFGVQQDYAEAAGWYRKAAVQGDSLAQLTLGRVYAQGRGVAPDGREALKWYKEAAKHGQTEALLGIGEIYLDGREGIPIDCGEARRWFERAVKEGRIEAFNSLGYICEHGAPSSGIAMDLQQAVRCYREAADKGDGKGQMNLGRMYLEGLGVDVEPVEAYKWFYLAHAHGEGISNHYLLELDGTGIQSMRPLSAEEIAEGKRRAEAWTAAHRAGKARENL